VTILVLGLVGRPISIDYPNVVFESFKNAELAGDDAASYRYGAEACQ
jgi:hypothetical protein